MTETDSKEHILKTTVRLLNEGVDPGQITIRQIAEQAGVGIGLVNYHYQSKDNLLNEAIGAVMQEVAGRWQTPSKSADNDSRGRLKTMLKENSDIGARFPKLMKRAVSFDLLHGGMNTAQIILTYLREIYGDERDENALRIQAFALIVTLQSAFLRSNEFQTYAGFNLLDKQQRDDAIELMINTIIN